MFLWPVLPGAPIVTPPSAPSVVSPQRVVTFHPAYLEDALSLGVLPIAGHRSPDLHAVLTPEQWNGLTELAQPANPEQIAELHADLLITPTQKPDQLKLLQQFAPVAQIGGLSTSYDWRKRHLEVAAALGRLAQGEGALRAYDLRANEVREELATAGLHPRVLLAYVGESKISVFGDETNGVKVLRDAGLLQGGGFDPHHRTDVSFERLQQLDCDALFLTPAPSANDAAVDAIRREIAILETQPLWQRLSVVRRGRVYFEDVYWQNTSPFTAEEVLADLETIFLNKPRHPLHWPAPTAP